MIKNLFGPSWDYRAAMIQFELNREHRQTKGWECINGKIYST